MMIESIWNNNIGLLLLLYLYLIFVSLKIIFSVFGYTYIIYTKNEILFPVVRLDYTL